MYVILHRAILVQFSRIRRAPIDMPSSSVLLPQEVLEHILSFLCNDPNSLKASSLVHSQWLVASRRYLFHTLSYHADEAKPFHLFLVSISFGELSRVTNYVKELIFAGQTSDLAAGRTRLSLSVLILIVQRLQALRSLEVEDVHLTYDFRPESSYLYPVSTTMQKLTFSPEVSLDRSSVQAFTSVLILFPNLKELQLWSLIWDASDDVALTGESGLLQHLEELTVCFDPSESEEATGLLKVCAAVTPQQGLRSLSALNVPGVACRTLADFLQAVGGNLQELTVDSSDQWSIDDWHYFGSQLNSLTSLLFFSTSVHRPSLTLGTPNNVLELEPTIRFLTHLPPNVTMVFLKLVRYSKHDIRTRIPWSRLGEVLDRLRSLHTIVLIGDPDAEEQTAEGVDGDGDVTGFEGWVRPTDSRPFTMEEDMHENSLVFIRKPIQQNRDSATPS